MQLQRLHDLIMTCALSNPLFETDRALHLQQRLILPAPNHLEWDFFLYAAVGTRALWQFSTADSFIVLLYSITICFNSAVEIPEVGCIV